MDKLKIDDAFNALPTEDQEYLKNKFLFQIQKNKMLSYKFDNEGGFCNASIMMELNRFLVESKIIEI